MSKYEKNITHTPLKKEKKWDPGQSSSNILIKPHEHLYNTCADVNEKVGFVSLNKEIVRAGGAWSLKGHQQRYNEVIRCFLLPFGAQNTFFSPSKSVCRSPDKHKGCKEDASFPTLPGGTSSIETWQFSKVLHQASCLVLSLKRLISSHCKLSQSLPLLALAAHFLVWISVSSPNAMWKKDHVALVLIWLPRSSSLSKKGCIVRAIPGIHLSPFIQRLDRSVLFM